MDIKKPAAPLQSGQPVDNCKHTKKPLSSKQRRLARALFNRRGVTREDADRIAHASNSPGVIFELRKRGIEIHTLRGLVLALKKPGLRVSQRFRGARSGTSQASV